MSTISSSIVGGEVVTIRPIRIADAEMEAEFVRRLSAQTKHYRFFGGMKELSSSEVLRMCNVDGRHSMAFVATIGRDGREVEVGVTRYAPDTHAEVREIAVTIADEWQHKGLDILLMRHLIEAARLAGVKQLYSVEQADNEAMRTLAKNLKMSARGDPDDPHQIIYSLQL
jgi:GNAT superfamily N-acetyltransferase